MCTYSWIINKKDRAWFIFPDGKIYGGIGHRKILKEQFKSTWNDLEAGLKKDKDYKTDDGEIEKIITHRFLMTGVISIGESFFQNKSAFYSNIQLLDTEAKNILYSFANSILNIRKELSESLITIYINYFNDKIIYTIKELSEGIFSDR